MKSMTGFGEAYIEEDDSYVWLKMTSVNNRHLDIHTNFSAYPRLERDVSKQIRKRIDRGKVEVQLESNVLVEQKQSLEVDRSLVSDYLRHLRDLCREFEDLELELEVLEVLSLPGVLNIQTKPLRETGDQTLLSRGVDQALDQMLEMRQKEGEELARDLAQRKQNISKLLEEIQEKVPEMLRRYRDRIEERISPLLQLHEDELQERVEKEMKMYADKCDISEEIVRVQSHLKQFDHYLQESGSVGKSLEFLLQEIQREINTVGAKANDALISQKAVDVKTELEKCREQVRNVE